MADDRLLPQSINDESTQALNELIDRLGSIDITPVLVYMIDNVAASALPHLAAQFHVTGYEGWLQTATEAERRALIKTAIAKHYYKGTPYAIRQVLENMGFTAETPEWFNYEGDPYHFKVEINTQGAELNAEKTLIIEKLVNEYKNVRSLLDVITFIVAVTSPVPVYNTGFTAHEVVTIYG